MREDPLAVAVAGGVWRSDDAGAGLRRRQRAGRWGEDGAGHCLLSGVGHTGLHCRTAGHLDVLQ